MSLILKLSLVLLNMQEQEWLDKNPFMQGWDFEIYSSPEQDSPFGGELFSMHLDLDLLGFSFFSFF